MGHIRLGALSASKRWRDVVGLLAADAPLNEIAASAAHASETDLARASNDPSFQFVARLLVELPFIARGPGFVASMAAIGIDEDALQSVPALLVGLDTAIEQHSFETGLSSDIGELARSALLSSLSEQLDARLPSLFPPEPQEIRRALGSLAGGKGFSALARSFFAKLTYGSLDYWLSRELAAHTGEGRRFAGDAERVAFERALYQHTYEASRIVEEFASGWYGKTVWRDQSLTPEKITAFARFAFKKMRDELGRRRVPA